MGPISIKVIASKKLIVNKRFNADASLLPVCGIDSNTKGILESIIVEISAGAGVDDSKEVLSGALPNRVGDTNNVANGVVTNKVVVTRGPKREVYI